MKKVFLHGWATDEFCFNELKKYCCNDRSCECLFLSLPGHHPDSTTDWSEPDIKIAAEDIKKRLEGIDDDFILIGWSLGGQVFIKYLADAYDDDANYHDKRVKGLILMNCSYRFTRGDGFPYGKSPALVKTMIKDLKKNEQETLKRFYGLNFTEEELTLDPVKEFLNYYESFKHNFHGESLINGLEVLLHLDLEAEAAKIKVPTLIITAKRDEVCSHKAAEDLKNIIKNSTVKTLDHLGHAPFVSDAKKINNLINDFVRANI